MFAPFFTFGQTISTVVITDSILCSGDPECVDITFTGLDNTSSYTIKFFDSGSASAGEVEDFTNSPIYTAFNNFSGTFNHCFELDGTYQLALYEDGIEVDSDSWITQESPFPLNVTQSIMSSFTTLLCHGDTTGIIKANITGGKPPYTFEWNGPNGYSFSEQSGLSSSLIQNLEAGSYVLNVTDNNDCPSSPLVTNIIEPIIISNNFTIVDELCFNSNDAQVTSNPLGGNGAPYTFAWSNGDTTQTIITGAGSYDLVIQDAQNCLSDTFSTNLDPIDLLTFTTPVVTDALCFGEDGTVTINASGGTGLIQFAWPSGLSPNATENLPAGDYSITITDANLCDTFALFSIGQPDEVVTSITSIEDVICFGESTGRFDFEIVGGAPSYTVSIVGLDNGFSTLDNNINASTAYFTNNLAQGNYEITVTDTDNCSDIDTVTINESPEIVSINPAITNVSCFGESTGKIIATIQGGSGVYDYTWTNSIGDTIGANFHTTPNIPAGVYDLNVNDGNCEANFQYTITEPAPVQYLTSSSTDISCFGANDGFISNTDVFGGTPPYTYVWRDLNAQTFQVQNPSNLAPSDYSLSIIDALNCTYENLFTESINEPSQITIQNLVANSPSCFNDSDGEISFDIVGGEPVIIGGAPIYSVLITEVNSGVTYNSPNINNLPSGIYGINISDSDPTCFIDTTIILENPDELSFGINFADVSCFGANDGYIAFDYTSPTGSHTFNVQFPSGGSSIQPDSISNLSPGTYVCTLQDNGCSKTETIIINEPLQTVYTPINTTPTSCNQNNVLQNQLIGNGTFSFIIDGEAPSYDYVINTDTNTAVAGQIITVSNLSAGLYAIEVLDSICSFTESNTVDAADEIIVSYSTTDITGFGNSNGAINVTLSGGQGPFSTNWVGPNNFSSNIEDINGLASGNYTLTVIDQNGCVEIQNINVNEDNCSVIITPTITEPDCPESSFQVTFGVSGGTAPYLCNMFGDLDGDGIDDPVLTNQSINLNLGLTLDLPTSENFELVVTDNFGCTQTFNFYSDPIEPIVVDPTIINVSCFSGSDGEIIIDPTTDISGGTSPYTIAFESSSGTTNPFNLSSDNYILEVIDANDCSEVFSYNVNEPDAISLSNSVLVQPNCITGSNDANNDGSIVVIPTGGTSFSDGSYEYFWNSVGLADQQSAENLEPGFYDITVRDANGCEFDSTFQMSDPNFIQYISTTSTNPSCNGDLDGSFIVETSNADNENFNWFNISSPISIGNNDTISNLSAGSYYFTISNNQNCYLESFSVLPANALTLIEPSIFNLQLINDESVPFGICDGDAFILNPASISEINWSTGETSPAISGLCEGSYFVEVIDTNGCYAAELFSINQQDCDFSIGSFIVNEPECNDSNDGQIITSAPFSSGNQPYQVRFFEGTNQIESFYQNTGFLNFDNLAAGEYYIIVEDSVGCIDDTSITIDEPSQITFSYTIENFDCYTTYDPEVHMTITGGTVTSGQYDVGFYGFEYWAATEIGGPEQYFPGNDINNGGTIFNVDIKDDNECQITIPQIIVPNIDPITVTANATSPRCYNENSGSVSLSIVGGSQPYEIVWYNSNDVIIDNQNNLSLDSLASGNYYVIVTDNLGCEVSPTLFTIDPVDDIVVTATVTDVSCEGFSDGSISITNVTGGNGGYSYQWFPGGFINPLITNLSVNDYQLTVIDSEGCTKTVSYEIVNPDDVEINLTSSPISCYDFSDGQLNASVPVGNVTEYKWYKNGIEMSPLLAGNIDNLINLGTGIYNVEVILNNDFDCPYSSSPIELSQPNEVIATFTSSDPTCFDYNDGEFSAVVTGGTLASGSDYSFNLIDASNNSVISNLPIFNQLFSSDYLFVATDDNGCTDSVNFTLNNPNDIVLNVTSSDPNCFGGNTGNASFNAFNTVGQVNPVWSEVISLANFNSISINESINNLSSGNYALTVTDSLGCTQQEIFTIDDPLQIGVTLFPNTTTCANTIEGSVTAQVTNATLPLNYLWTINQPNNITQIGVSNTASFTTDENLNVGTITLTGTDANGCLLPETDVVLGPSINPLIQAEINVLVPNVCHGDSVAEIEANLIYDDNSPVLIQPTFEWYKNGVLISGSNGGSTNQLVNLGPGEYYVIVVDQDYGCVDTSETVVFTDAPQMDLIVTDLQNVDCYGNNNGSVSIDVVNGIGTNFNYLWNNTMGLSIPIDNDNPTNLIAGQYELVVDDFLNGCTAEATIEITQPDSIMFDLSQNFVTCFGGEDGNITVSNISGGDGNFNYLWTDENNNIVSTSNFTDSLSSQTYTIVVSDGNGCSSSESINLNQPENITVVDNITDIDCFGENTGSISLSVTGGTPGYSYLWANNSSNLSTIFNLVAGNYPLNIIDGNDCIYSFEFEVEQQAQIVADATGTFVSCSEGFANIVNITGGAPPYNNYWQEDPSNTSSSISGLTPGYHEFYVTDGLNCTVIDSVLIDGTNEIITNAFAVQDVLCNSESSGSIFVDILNYSLENSPYYYSVNDLSFTNINLNDNFYINDLPTGSYTIYLKDADDCIDSTLTINISEPDTLIMSTSFTNISCYGDTTGVITVDASGGVGQYDISLDGGLTFVETNSAGQESFTLSAGDYTLVVMDDNDCSLLEEITISQPDEVLLTTSNFSDFNGFNTSCFNSNDGSFEVNVSGGILPYSLSFDNALIVVNDGDIIDSISAGTYALELTDFNGCSIQTEVIITAPNDINLEYVSSSDFNGLNTSCFNSEDGFVITSVVGGVGPFDYSLNNGLTYEASNTIAQYQFSNLSSGEYTFSVKDDNECIAEVVYTVTSSPAILPDLTLEEEILCNGAGQATLLASVNGGIAPYVYTLTGLINIDSFNSVESSILIENLSSGFYELNVTDANGCNNSIAAASQIVVPEPSPVTYSANINPISCNSEGNGSVEIFGLEGGQSPYNLEFYNSNGVYFEYENLNAFSPALIFESLASGTYTLIIIDGNDCEFIDSIVIAEPSELSLDVDYTNVSCNNGNDGTIELSIMGGTAPFAITINDEPYTSNGDITIEGLTAQDYTIVVVDAYACDISSSLTITQPDSINIETIVINNLCYNQTNGSIITTVSGGVAPYSFSYTNANGVLISETNIADNLSSASYTINVSDSYDCFLSSDIEITEPAEISVSHELSNESCVDTDNGSILTTVSDFQGSYDIFWAANNMNGTENYGLSPGIYALTVVDSVGCFITDSVSILAAAEFNFSLNVTNAECRYTNDGQLSIVFNDQENHSALLSSEETSLQTSGSSDLVFEGLAEGEYNLQVSYNGLCTFDTVVSIEASNSYDCITPEPSFSPNYDGTNDEFMPLNNFAEVVDLIIFNRWGAKIFESQSANPKWDGTNLNGELVPSADYYYIIKFNNPAYNDITGIITLLK